MNKQELLDLPKIHKQINTCTDDNLNMICEKLNRIYSLSFFDLWDFTFNNKKQLSEKIYLSDEINYSNIKKYNGLILEDQNFNQWEDALESIKQSIKKDIPVMIHMYRKLFPWDINYMKPNVPDFFIHKAMAIDINQENILFTDGYCNQFNKYLSIEQCKKSSSNKITKIIICDDIHIDLNKYFNDFKNNQKRKTYIFRNIEKFEKELQNEETIEQLDNYKGDMYIYSPMYNSLNKITRSRKKIKQLLEDLGKNLKNEQILELSKEFEKSIINWEYINLIFEKYAFTLNKRDIQKSSKCLKEILNIERDLYKKLEGVEV